MLDNKFHRIRSGGANASQENHFFIGGLSSFLDFSSLRQSGDFFRGESQRVVTNMGLEFI